MTITVRLETLDKLIAFHEKNKALYPYSGQGCEKSNLLSLGKFDWVFGKSKIEVVEVACEWSHNEIKVRYYDWASDKPSEHRGYFLERAQYRTESIGRGKWTSEKETEYQSRSPFLYRGWWELDNLPGGIPFYSWFSDYLPPEELTNPNMEPKLAERTLKEQTFDSWGDGQLEPIVFRESDGLKEYIDYWVEERENGSDYYGNEVTEDKSVLKREKNV